MAAIVTPHTLATPPLGFGHPADHIQACHADRPITLNLQAFPKVDGLYEQCAHAHCL